MASISVLSSSIFCHSHSAEVVQLPLSPKVRPCSTLMRVNFPKPVRATLPFSGELVGQKSPERDRVVMHQGTITNPQNHREDIVSVEEDLEVLQWQSRLAQVPLVLRHRQFFLLSIAILAIAYGSAFGVHAEEEPKIGEEDKDVFGDIQSFFDPNEKTKSGKILPKSYLKSAREVVRTLRESLKNSTEDIVQFRKSADAAKESIREYLGAWKGKETVSKEESYVALENALRSLARFYSKAGPSASLPEEIKNNILDDLNKAEAFL